MKRDSGRERTIGLNQRGQVAVEYAIMAATLVVAAAVITSLFHPFAVGSWVDAAKEAFFVPGEEPGDIEKLMNEAVDR